MAFEDAKKIAEEAKTRPRRTTIIVFIAIVIIAVIAYVQGFFTEKGTQHAKPSTSAQEDQFKPPTKQTKQETHGDQSPAIVTDDNVKIVYEGEKESQ